MRQVITGILVQVEITNYNEAGQVASRPKVSPQFAVLEADIPESISVWVHQMIERSTV